MADLGEFGRAVAESEYTADEADTFRFHGERFTVPAAVSSLVLMKFTHSVKAAQAAETAGEAKSANAQAVIDRAASPQAVEAASVRLAEAEVAVTTARTNSMAAMYEYVLGCIGEEQFPAFERVCIRDGVDADELMDVCARIFTAVSGRPTRRPSESSDGPSSTGGTSMGGSASPEPGPGLRIITAQDPPVWGTEPETDNERQIREARQHAVPVAELLGIRSGT